MPVPCGWIPVLGGYPDLLDIHSGYQLGYQNDIWWISQGVMFDLIFGFCISLIAISGNLYITNRDIWKLNYVGCKDADIQPRY